MGESEGCSAPEHSSVHLKWLLVLTQQPLTEPWKPVGSAAASDWSSAPARAHGSRKAMLKPSGLCRCCGNLKVLGSSSDLSVVEFSLLNFHLKQWNLLGFGFFFPLKTH